MGKNYNLTEKRESREERVKHDTTHLLLKTQSIFNKCYHSCFCSGPVHSVTVREPLTFITMYRFYSSSTTVTSTISSKAENSDKLRDLLKTNQIVSDRTKTQFQAFWLKAMTLLGYWFSGSNGDMS